eukprot:2422530-Prymnesium_polylepis.1
MPSGVKSSPMAPPYEPWASSDSLNSSGLSVDVGGAMARTRCCDSAARLSLASAFAHACRSVSLATPIARRWLSSAGRSSLQRKRLPSVRPASDGCRCCRPARSRKLATAAGSCSSKEEDSAAVAESATTCTMWSVKSV